MASEASPAQSSNSKPFSPVEAISVGFKFFKENLITFIKLGAVLLVINVISGMFTGGDSNSGFAVLMSIASAIVSILVQIGMTKILLDLHDGKTVNFHHLYSLYPMLLRYLGASILYGLMVAVGIIFLVVPGIYLAIKYQFYGILIVDKNLDIMASLKKSGEMTKGNMMNLFVLGLLLIVINFVGAMLLGLGLLITIPTSMMAMIYVYRKLF